MTGTLREALSTFKMPRQVPLRMRNVVHKSCTKVKTILMFKVFPKIVPFM